MENPAEEIEVVVRGLLCKPTPKQQEDVLRRYFTPTARLYDINLNQEGLENLIPTYNFTLFILRYQDVIFHHVMHDEGQNALSLHLTVVVRPIARISSADSFRILVLVELEEGRDSRDGRVKKYIKVQRNFFQRDIAIKCLPIIGDIYGSDILRFLFGRGSAFTFQLLRYAWATFVPKFLHQILWEVWVRGPHGPPEQCGTAADRKFAAWAQADDLGDQSSYQPQ